MNNNNFNKCKVIQVNLNIQINNRIFINFKDNLRKLKNV